MPHRFNGRYRIASARLPGWHYATPGLYFVTWCTAHRASVEGQMRVSPPGAVVQAAVESLGYPSVCLDAFVVMPDHVHVLVALGEGAAPLSVVVNGWKANATRSARRNGLLGPAPLWQSRYWDRIVRDEAEAERVRTYIARNPARWREHP